MSATIEDPLSGAFLKTYAKRRETGKEKRVQVPCDEGIAIHSGPESCAVAREGLGEALTGVRIGQPLSPRKFPILGADTVNMVEGSILGRVSASAWTTRRGQRPWHVQTLLAREPGDLAIDRSATAIGPHREGEEP
ncbi:MAG: hypothetical protein WA231_06575 [Methylocella sp.]